MCSQIKKKKRKKKAGFEGRLVMLDPAKKSRNFQKATKQTKPQNKTEVQYCQEIH